MGRSFNACEDSSYSVLRSTLCAFTTDNLDGVRETIRNNTMVEGNDQIVSGAEYVIVRDFLYWDNEFQEARPLKGTY